MNETWAELNQEEIILQEQIENSFILDIDKEKKLQKIKELIRNPLVFREL
ncbi:MAG: hypothetical protein LBD75_00810 [Candidatus Peribacteria bacterium]|jgi:hypothetical protein|nr:hypothetical protein [Candidatus Peribacteria bacterium]